MHELALPLLVALIVVALAFDFLNGLHDAANSIATVVGTRLITPVGAVAFAAFFNFAAYFLALKWPELHNVANTIGKGLIDKDLVTPAVVFAALVGAMFWNVATWVKGIPSSSSHALVGGIVGAGVAHAGFPSIQWLGLNKTLVAIVLSPTLGLILTMLIMLVTSWVGVRASARDMMLVSGADHEASAFRRHIWIRTELCQRLCPAAAGNWRNVNRHRCGHAAGASTCGGIRPAENSVG